MDYGSPRATQEIEIWARLNLNFSRCFAEDGHVPVSFQLYDGARARTNYMLKKNRSSTTSSGRNQQTIERTGGTVRVKIFDWSRTI